MLLEVSHASGTVAGVCDGTQRPACLVLAVLCLDCLLHGRFILDSLLCAYIVIYMCVCV